VTGTFSDGLDEVWRARALHRDELGHGALAGPLLAAVESDLLLALGRGNQARAVAYGPHRDHPLLRVTQARLALLTGDAGEALRLATDSAWERRALARGRIEMLLIRAVAAHRTDDDNAARAAFTRAVDAARSASTLRPFRTIPDEDLHALAAGLSAARELLASPALQARPEIFPATVALIVLTPREQELLERLAGNLTRQQIANSLRTSLNTVKVQLRGLFKKLDVESRADAVARGRAYGLLR
jgi:LuxR family maltose regulon positive regulatory protein